jgi:phosphoglycolate phosphatase-like HAD superfamily hydrolase
LLLLFDIDGTLVQGASREHAVALMQALHNVHGISTNTIRRHGSAAGRTDGEIARLILLEADVEEECCRLYAGMCPADLSELVVDGIPPTLEWLAGLEGVQLALVTGNFERVARVKLRAAGIGHWFPTAQGGFGSDSEDRSMLPPIARRRAGEAAGLGSSWPREQTLVIGDTPRDIACAHADGVRCVAVTSGPDGDDDLAQADAVVRSSAELRTELARLLGV